MTEQFEKWWKWHPIIAPLPRGFMDEDKSHKETREWMKSATAHIEAQEAEIERLRAALSPPAQEPSND